MPAKNVWPWMLAVAVCVPLGVKRASAEDAEFSMTTVPVRYVVVDENAGKFEAQHWMKAGYSGGVQNFSGHLKLRDGTAIEGGGHALIDAGDLGGDLSIKKDNVGYLKFDYSAFRKYFDTGAGVHREFSTLQAPDTDKDLRLNIGKFGFETGLTIENMPEVSFSYEREFKHGTKSRLTWPTVKEAGEARKIAPSWQEVDETVDLFKLKASKEVAGFNLHGEQQWEADRSETFREEDALATTGVASDTKIRRQNQQPTANLLTTTLGGEGSFLEDKVYVSSGFRFNHIKNSEFETLAEYSGTGVLTNYTYPEQEPNNHANSHYDAYTWVESVTVRPVTALSLGTNLKSEIIKRHSNSTRNHDGLKTSSSGSADAPDGIVDSVDSNLADTKAVRWGEQVSIRYSGIPRTALYTELELELTRLLLREDEKSTTPSGGAVTSFNDNSFSRETVTHVDRRTWTLGGRVDPWRFLDVTSQVRYRSYNNDYDDQRETVNSSSAKSAFFDGQFTSSNEFSTRVTFKPCRWFKPSFRYQLRADKYATAAEAQQIVKTSTLSNIYTFDVVVEPLPNLITTTSFSRQTAATRTPASLTATSSGGLPSYTTPTYNANVNTWLFGADYPFKNHVTLSGTLQYTRANNFNDYSVSAQPYGAKFQKLDLTTGLKWALSDKTSVGVDYGLYTYNPDENVENGGYVAHTIWLDVSKKF